MPGALGLFGGTFDPVHYGHLRAAAEVRDALGLAEMRLLPAGDPAHRAAPQANAMHRLAMLELALQAFPGLVIDSREIHRTGKSYTVLTLEELRAEMPARPIACVVGADTFAGLPEWHRWREVFDLAHLVVVTRPGLRIEGALTGALRAEWEKRMTPDLAALETAPGGAIFRVPVTPQPISATAIRDALASGPAGAAKVRGLLPAEVFTYIDRHQLYRPRSDAT